MQDVSHVPVKYIGHRDDSMESLDTELVAVEHNNKTSSSFCDTSAEPMNKKHRMEVTGVEAFSTIVLESRQVSSESRGL